MSHQNLDLTSGGLRVAVIGGGISGIVASHLISRRNHVTLFEKEPQLGGHTHTARVNRNGGQVPVDMGFIVFNEPNYPTFNSFLSELGVERAESDMSFAFHDPATGFMYAGTGIRGMLARKRNLISPVFWRMISGIKRFCTEAKKDLEQGRLEGVTIGEYLEAHGYSREFEDNYLLPMAGSIWSAPDGEAHDFPAEALVRFFDNHMLLDYMERPPWYFVKGGSDTYVRAFAKTFTGEVRTGTPVWSVKRNDTGVHVATNHGSEDFDAVVLATHASDSLRLLSDADENERRLLGPWRYAANRVVLHTDEEFLPPRIAGRASWNFIRDPGRPADSPVGVSYHMNRLQGIQSHEEYVVTLNPVREPISGTVIKDVLFEHPQYSLASMATQKELPELDGHNRTFYCGAYQGYGFHEDGARSGARVAAHFGESF
ncbi:NAD(P)/FAD-dependent oxidoreductase [Desulfovibrio oxyclinae]|uniref:NAD(P)/FAD-dependent oxidoreductase n=1 Tax=Desulfovibrio oxyclinae TaxID=63560 RepID=UPI0003804C8F|nr:FAD-dependent oxidoreductase [Desulfovibrio oxyclinae]